MRVLLMLPYDKSYNWAVPDLGLGYIAGSLRKEGHDVQMRVNPAEFATEDDFRRFIRQGNFDLIGIKVIYSAVNAARKTIHLIRNTASQATIVLGGPHVSADPQNIFNIIPEADYAFHGEGEKGIVEFAGKFCDNGPIKDGAEKITNLIWRRGREIVVNASEPINDLDSIPFPAWELMAPRKFKCAPFNNSSRRYPIAPLLMTRGCPSKCTFCGAGLVQGNRLRSRSVDNIMSEIRFLTSQFGVREIHFFDSNCAHRLGPLKDVCKRIISEEIDISWCAPNGIRIDSIDEELAVLMKESGCFQVSVGIESGSLRILKQIKKGISTDMVRKRVSILRKNDIEVNGFFVIGFPGEKIREIEETVSFALELPLTSASFSILTPLPGTELYHEVYNGQELNIEAYRSLSFMDYKNNLSEASAQWLMKMQMNAYLRFYLRPRIIYYFLKNLNNIQKIGFLFLRVFSVLSVKKRLGKSTKLLNANSIL